MADFILTMGDLAMFNPAFGAAIVTVIPGNLTGTGKMMINKKMACIKLDTNKVSPVL